MQGGLEASGRVSPFGAGPSFPKVQHSGLSPGLSVDIPSVFSPLPTQNSSPPPTHPPSLSPSSVAPHPRQGDLNVARGRRWPHDEITFLKSRSFHREVGQRSGQHKVSPKVPDRHHQFVAPLQKRHLLLLKEWKLQPEEVVLPFLSDRLDRARHPDAERIPFGKEAPAHSLKHQIG